MQSGFRTAARGGADLIDRFAEVVLEAEHPRQLAERTLEVALLVTKAVGAATFSCEGDKLALYVSVNIDQAVVDAVQAIWSRSRESLQKGEVTQVRDRAADQASTQEPSAERGLVERVVVPVFHGDALVGLLYFEGPYRTYRRRRHATLLTRLSRILAKSLCSSQLPEAASGS